MGVLRRRPTAAPTEEDLKGVRRFTYEVDPQASEGLPYKCTFEGKWSRHGLDVMLKHASKALRVHKAKLLKELKEQTNERRTEE